VALTDSDGRLVRWGDDLGEARQACARENLKIGVSPEDARRIVASVQALGLGPPGSFELG